MKYRYWMGLVASVCMVNVAHADLINVSTTSLESSTEEAIACTIIATTGATYQGYKVLVAFSEAVGSDANPTMRVQSLRSNIVYTNDDWQGMQYLNGQALGNGTAVAGIYTNGVGRTPNTATDSGILTLFAPGDAVCAYSKEVSHTSLKKVSVALTDITDKVLATKNLSTAEAFTLQKWLPSR